MIPAPSLSASAPRLAAWRRLSKLRRATGARSAEPEQPVPWEPAGRRERSQADRLVRGVLRNLSLLDAYIHRPRLFDPHKTAAAILWALRLAAYEKIFQAGAPDYAIGAQTVQLARQAVGERAGKFVNAIIRRLLPELPDSPAALRQDPFWAGLPEPVRWSVPGEILRELRSGYGDLEVGALIRALSEEEAPVWLRVNTLKTTPEKLALELSAEGSETRRLESVPEEALIWVSGSRPPWETEAWRRGELTVQDVGAMLAARLLDPAPGMAALDLCAAPGGKTGHLWELMRARGRLTAVEIHSGRRAEMRRALERLYGGPSAIETPDCAALEELPGRGEYDRVLIDAPCQALGLIRRRPEIRWDERLRFQAAMQATQRRILEAGGKHLKPGGRLLWVTCSPTAAENEEVLNPWLEGRRGWSIMDPAGLLRAEWLRFLQIDRGFVRTRPDRLACDGFAMALLERAE